MKIETVDKNFIVATDIDEPNIVWYNAKDLSLHGVFYSETEKRYLRLPQEIAKTVSDSVAFLNTCTSGGRVRFRTNSSYIAIRAVMNLAGGLPLMAKTGHSGFDLYRDFEGQDRYFFTFIPQDAKSDGYLSGVKTYGELTDYTINFPLYNGVQELYIGLKQDAILQNPTPYRYPAPIVFYGSSITQGGCASRPGNSYQGFLSRRLHADFINLGFSGSGKGEKEMAEYIATLPMQLFVLDYDSNAPSEEWLQNTHYPFFKIIREKNPTLPIVIISHPSALHRVYYECKADSSWGNFENRKNIIFNTYQKAKNNGDNNVYFIDGKEIFQGEEWDAVTVDGIHPNDLGFFRFAQTLEKTIKPLLEE